MLSIIAALLLISVLITVHELGHYGVGRLLGFSIVDFSIGMGPAIIKKHWNGIDYVIRAFPIGGMCRFYGEDETPTDTKSFNSHPVWKRMLVILAGPVMNILFALLFSIVTLLAYGNYVPSVHEIPETGSPAYVSGMQTGDVIVAVDGRKIRYYSETVDFIRAMDSGEAVITVERAGKRVDCVLRDTFDAEAGYNRIGITIAPVRKMYGLFESFGESINYITGVVSKTLGFLGGLFTGQASTDQMAGWVGTIAYIAEAVRYGLETVLRLAVVISISLGIFNILPLPALDGGRLAFLIVEAIRGKPVDQRIEGTVHFVGLLLLLAFIVFLTVNDIRNLL